MRILVVSQYFWPENFRVNDLVSELQSRGHEVTVLTGIPNYPEGRVPPAFQKSPGSFAAFAGARVVRVPLVPRGQGSARLLINYASFAVSGALLGAWRLRGTRFDVVFVFQPSPITSCIPALAIGRMMRAPVLLWTLDLWPETLAAVGVLHSPWLLGVVSRGVGIIYRGCTLVLGQSRSFRGSVRKHAGSDATFRYFPSWAEEIFTSPLQEVAPAAEVLALGPPAFNIVFAGNIGEAQDFTTILAAATVLRDRHDIRWVFIGDGRAADQVRRSIVERGLAATVVMLGRHPVERMPSFFRAAGALLVTLRADPVFALTIPGKLQAYLAAGVPVLGALNGEGARVIEDSGAGLVAPSGDAAALAAHAVALAALPASERAAMGARAKAYCAAEFDRTMLMTRLEQLMQEAIALYSSRG